MKKIGIIGSRRRDTEDDFNSVWQAFTKVYEDGDTIVSGGCPKGGDRFAEIIAGRMGANMIIHWPEKVPPGSPRWAYTKANYARNTLVAQDSDIIIACVAADRKGGTEDTIKKFKKFYPDGVVYLV